MRYLMAVHAFFLLVSTAKAEGYSPRDFVKAAPAELFYTDDEMSEEEKQALVKNGFKKKKQFDCSAWGVAEESKDRMVLQYCSDSSVTVQVYRTTTDPKAALVAVLSSRGSGRSSDLALFQVTTGQEEFAPLSTAQLSSIGVTALTENDFLKDDQKFPAQDAQAARLTLAEDSTLRGELNNWMDPRWEHRSEAYEIAFAWNNGRFELRKNEIAAK